MFKTRPFTINHPTCAGGLGGAPFPSQKVYSAFGSGALEPNFGRFSSSDSWTSRARARFFSKKNSYRENCLEIFGELFFV